MVNKVTVDDQVPMLLISKTDRACLATLLAPPVAGSSVTGNVTEDGAGAFVAGYAALAEYLDQIVDHQSRQGLRYELVSCRPWWWPRRRAPGMTR
jgi:hypothetical protein